MSFLAGETLADERHLQELREADLRMRTEKTKNILELGVDILPPHTMSGERPHPLHGQEWSHTRELSLSPGLGLSEGFNLEFGWEGKTLALCHYWAAQKIQQLHASSSFGQGFASTDLVLLRDAAETKDCREFARIVRTVNWGHYPPAGLTHAIDLALALDMVQVARELAQEGRKIFPRNERIQRAAEALLPSFLMRTRPSEIIDVESSQQWLKHHASQYRGQWLAVRAGILLGSASTVKALYQQIGPQGRTPNTIIVKVLS
jgi:hypothetical protein